MYQYRFDGNTIPVDTQKCDSLIDGYIMFDDGMPVNWQEKRYINGALQDVIAPINEPISIEECKANRIMELKVCRNNAESATPFVYDGSGFDYDSLSRERIDAAVSASTIAALAGTATNTVVATWTLADNTTRDMTIGDWLAFRQAEVARSAACHSKYNTLKTRVTASTTVEEVNAINW